MARLRILVIAALVLALGSCQVLEQQENFISFTWDGVQYLFTASAATEGRPWAADHPYAVSYYWGANPPYAYMITGSAGSEDPQAETNTIQINIQRSDGAWNVDAYIWDSYGNSTWFDLGQIPDGMIDTAISGRDSIGGQFSGSMPGMFYEDGPSTLSNILFSVERLPNVEQG